MRPGIQGGWRLVALVIITVTTHLPALFHPKAIDDERIYSVVAIEMLEGGKPYVHAVERKPPLLFWTYTGIFRVLGRYNTFGLHVVAVLWVLLTMAGLYATAGALFDQSTAFYAALLYGVYHSWLFGANLALNGEVLMNLPIAWALFVTMRPTASRIRLELLAAGILLCAAFLLKQPAAIAGLPLGLYLLSPGYRQSRGLETRHSVLHSVWLTLGFFGTLGLVALALQAQGILREAYYWTITNHDLPLFRWGKGLLMSLGLALFAWPLVGPALISLAEHRGRPPGLWGRRRPEIVALTLLFVVSLIGTAAGGRFYHHYFIQLIPPLALLAAPVWTAVMTGAYSRPRWLITPRILAIWVVASVAVSLVSQTRELAARAKVSEVGRFIQTHSAPDDRIFVWGQAAGLYLEAKRRPASRYIQTFPLTGYVFGLPRDAAMPNTRHRVLPDAWPTFEREVKERPPRFIIDAEVVRSSGPRYPTTDFPVLRRLLARDYRLVERAWDGWIYQRNF